MNLLTHSDMGARVGDALQFALNVEPPFNADGIEIAGCIEEGGIVSCVEGDEMPQFFSVYWHISEGGCDCFADMVTLNEARILADLIQSRFSFRKGILER